MLRKKLLAITIISILAIAYFLPVFAQKTAETEPPYECWPQDLCQGNWAQTAKSKESCGPYEKSFGKPLGFCYAKPPTVNLQIAIGGKTVQGLRDYIPRIYNYMVSIVSIIAIVMIMVGGLRYLTASGNQGAVTKAKETILGAVIGLFLTFGSYILLQTINPALVSLKLPDIKLVRSSPLQKPNITGGECYTKRDKTTCEASCPGCRCNAICETNLEKITQATWEAMGLLAGAGNPTAVLTGLKTLGKTVGKPLLKFAWKHKITTAGASILAYWGTGGGADDGERGICYGSEKGSVGDWGVCEQDTECKEGSKCINASGVLQSGTTGEGQTCSLYKLCSNGDVGRPCNTGSGQNDCKIGLTCFKMVIPGALGICGKPSEQPELTECSDSNDCWSRNCYGGACGGGGASQATRACKAADISTLCNTIVNGQILTNGGTCLTEKSIYNAVQSGSGITISNQSQCSNKCKKCANNFNWLFCSGKMPTLPTTITNPDALDAGGTCLANAGKPCNNDSDCLYQCVSGQCTDWLTNDCAGWGATSPQCSK